VKVFSHEEYAFDDIFPQKETFTEVNHMSSLLFGQEELEVFHRYRERRSLKVSLDQLLIEPIREPNPSVRMKEAPEKILMMIPKY